MTSTTHYLQKRIAYKRRTQSLQTKDYVSFLLAAQAAIED